MQAAANQPARRNMGRKLSFLLGPPLVAFVVATLALAFIINGYESRHRDAIFTGVSVAGIDMSQMSPEEAAAALVARIGETEAAGAEAAAVTLHDPVANRSWQFTAAELGVQVDVAATIDAAYAVGREGNPARRLQAMFQSWYYGRNLSPIIIMDQGQLNGAIGELSRQIDQQPINATLALEDDNPAYQPSQLGRDLDEADLRQRLLPALTTLQPAEVELLVHTTQPAVSDSGLASEQIQRVLSTPLTFYLPEPLADTDLMAMTVPEAELARWLRFELVEQADGTFQHEVFVDENAARQWLSQFDAQIYREPVKARFYFDDFTRELVLVSPHVNGRALDVDATLQNLVKQIGTPDHDIPFVVREIVPTVNANATAAELGITELISEKTTWFYGSSDERKHNIARSAANFYGIVIAPGEEFSFNKYLGSISEADGYEEGLIIVGGQTIRGIGGGVCQVSTTVYQTAFFAGFPIVARLEHGYWLDYYNDGEGPGMDATVYSPIVDFRFINNTPHHLLIENYYNEEFEALTFKFYSTSMGWSVEKGETIIANETEVPGPEQDRWEFDPDLPPGTVEQIDYATQGADVTVQRIVRDADGTELINEFFVSNYIPYPNTFHYGPGVEPYDYSLVPEEEENR